MKLQRAKETFRILLMLLAVAIMLLFAQSCGLQKRTVDKQNIQTKFSDQSIIDTKRPGDIIFLPTPRTPQERPRDTIIVTKGERGATATTSYDKEGYLSGQVINCPEEQETKRLNIKEESEIRLKQIERSANIELVNAVGKWMAITFIPIGFFFAVAFVLRGVLK